MTEVRAPRRLRRRECEAGVSPCGAPALLYPCGLRCTAHRPGAPVPDVRTEPVQEPR